MKTFAMIKPSCIVYSTEVEAAIIAAGLRIETSAEVRFTREMSEEFYAEHKGKPFFEGLVAMISSAPVRVYCLSGENAIQVWRDLIGPTNPNKGKEDQLRRKYADAEAYAAGSPDNGFHGSANPEDAEREIDLMRKWQFL
jgi:nucleoside-diphosphate kinase